MVGFQLGPNSMGVTTPKRCPSTGAQVTGGLPGPRIFRTFGNVSVPKASAATPAGPLARNTARMPSSSAVTSTASSTAPAEPGTGGTTTAISGTPATTAGVPICTSTEGYDALPLGTNR